MSTSTKIDVTVVRNYISISLNMVNVPQNRDLFVCKTV